MSERTVRKINEKIARQEEIIREEKSELIAKGYRYISHIGSGSFSDVFRVWDAQRNCFLACKVSVYPKLAVREAKLLQELQHPLFPQYKENWQSGDKHYLLMEEIAGSSIRELIQNRGYFSQRQAVHIAFALAQGLQYLHERSEPIVFRDIKPENVMVRQDGSVKLVDVGCACRKGESKTIAGSRGYGAPEQFQRKENVSEESDIYALGNLLFLMLTGEEPCKMEELLCKKNKYKRNRYKKNQYKKNQYKKKIAPGLLQLIAQATKNERSRRLPDMRTFCQRLTIYEGRRCLSRFYTDARALLCGGLVADFYYVQNVRRDSCL